ncbi:hypothetical protein GYB22_03285 [bacterium]|nr:hypothetical protein [bacterium]
MSETKDKAGDSVQLVTLQNASKILSYNGFKAQNRDLLNSALQEPSVPSYTSVSHYNLGMDYLDINPELATYHFEQSAALVEDQPKTPEYIRAVEKLSESYAKEGKYKEALSSYKKYVELVDSMKIADLKAELRKEVLSAQFEVQEARIKDLEDAQIAGALELKRQQRTILGLAVGLSLFLVLTYFLVKNIRDKQRSNLQIQLASLRSRMNPHFIFNSLNSVNEYISLNDEVKANHYLSDFSKLMRTVLDNSNHATISLSEEIQSLEIYLKLEHARFEDQFDYEIEIEEGLQVQALSIPPMLIQPYIENAIWHGLRYKENQGNLELSFSKHKNKLRVEIADDGIGRARSKEMKTPHQKDYQSMGIKTTEERIRLLNELNKTSVEVRIEDAFPGSEDVGTRVILSLPLDYSE